MVDNESGRLRAVAWLELLPWLCLFRTFRLAIGIRLLLLSAVAIFITFMGWSVIGWVFSNDLDVAQRVKALGDCPWLSITEMVADEPGLPQIPRLDGSLPNLPATNPVWGSWKQLSQPFFDIFRWNVTKSFLAYALLCGLWVLAVWAFFGGAITRTVAVQLARDERIGWLPMIRHAVGKWRAYFAAPLFPLAGVLAAMIPIAFLGLFLRLNLGVFLAALVWPLALLGGLVMAVLLLGLIFGWPLMWATIGTEGTDSFDALSRSYAYVFQRPLHYLFYVLVAGLFGALGWLLVSNFAAAVVLLTYWAASWTAGWQGGAPRIDVVIKGAEGLDMIGSAGAALIRFWVACVKLLAVGFLYSYFWTASTAIYFLLRRDVDATEVDEVSLDEEEDEQLYGLPPLETDEEGAPVVSDDLPEDADADADLQDEE